MQTFTLVLKSAMTTFNIPQAQVTDPGWQQRKYEADWANFLGEAITVSWTAKVTPGQLDLLQQLVIALRYGNKKTRLQ